jgi:hypothetical protein
LRFEIQVATKQQAIRNKSNPKIKQSQNQQSKQIPASLVIIVVTTKQTTMSEAATTAQPVQELFIKMAVMAWDAHVNRVSKLLNELTDEQLAAEVAPGRNTGTYLLGHLVAVTDAMMPLLGFGEKRYPELEKVFLTSPDKSGLPHPSLPELRKYWQEVNTRLSNSIANTPPDDWFTRHTAVSEEAFAKEPFRNKLNVLINRTNHQSYHWGQLVFLGKKKAD